MNAATQTSPCKSCEMQGLPILPCVYAIIPVQQPNELPSWANHPDIKSLPLPSDYKLSLRTTRPGFIYVYDPKEGRPPLLDIGWQCYSISESGLLTFTSLDVEEDLTKVELSAACAMKGDLAKRVFFCIQDPTKKSEVWIAYSEHKWSKETRKQYSTNEGLRKQRMQKINPQALVAGQTQPSSTPVSASSLDDIVDYKGVGTGKNYLLKHDDGGYQIPTLANVSGTNFDFQEDFFSALPTLYSHSKKRVPGKNALIDSMNSRKGKVNMSAPGIILALPDGAGMAREMNNWMQFAQSYAESLYQEPPIDWARESMENIQHAEAYLTAMEVWKLKNKFLEDTTKERLDGEWDLNGDRVQKKLELQDYLRKVEAEEVISPEVIYGDLLYELKAIYQSHITKISSAQMTALYDVVKARYVIDPKQTDAAYQADLALRVEKVITKHRSHLLALGMDGYQKMVEKLQEIVTRLTTVRNEILFNILQSNLYLTVLSDYEQTDIDTIVSSVGVNVEGLWESLKSGLDTFNEFISTLINARNTQIIELKGFNDLLASSLANVDCTEYGRKVLKTWANEMSTDNPDNLLFRYFYKNDLSCKKNVDIFCSELKNTTEQPADQHSILDGNSIDFSVGLYKQLVVANKVLTDELISQPWTLDKMDKAFLSLTNSLTFGEHTHDMASAVAKAKLMDFMGAQAGEAFFEKGHLIYIHTVVTAHFEPEISKALQSVRNAQAVMDAHVNLLKSEFDAATERLKSAQDKLKGLLAKRLLPPQYYFWILESDFFLARVIKGVEDGIRPETWQSIKTHQTHIMLARTTYDLALDKLVNRAADADYIKLKNDVLEAQKGMETVNNKVQATTANSVNYIRAASGLALVVVGISCVELYRIGQKWTGSSEDYVKSVLLGVIVAASVADIILTRVPEVVIKKGLNVQLLRLGRLSATGLFAAGALDVYLNLGLAIKSFNKGKWLDTSFFAYKTALGGAWALKGAASFAERGGVGRIGLTLGSDLSTFFNISRVRYIFAWQFLVISVAIEMIYFTYIKDSELIQWFEKCYFGEDGKLLGTKDGYNSKEQENQALLNIINPPKAKQANALNPTKSEEFRHWHKLDAPKQTRGDYPIAQQNT